MVEKHDFEALIVRYLEGNATPEEAMLLEDWKQSSPENQKQFDHYQRLFLKDNLTDIDVDSAWKRVSKQISGKSRIVSFTDWRYWAVAAAAILVIALIVPALYNSGSETIGKGKITVAVEPEKENILYAKNGIQNYTLTDSSVVELKSGSSLELSENFENGERRAKLKGSGRFTVVHDEKHPFVIDVEGLEVYDIGTIFDISTNKDTVKVVVLEGAVELRKDGQLLAMEEGDSAFYLISQRLIKEYPTRESLSGITQTFDGASFSEIVSHLSEFFNVHMSIMDESLKTVRLKVSFDDAGLAEVIMILEAIMDIRTVRSTGKIEFYESI